MRFALTLLYTLIAALGVVGTGLFLFEQSREFAGAGVEHVTGTVDYVKDHSIRAATLNSPDDVGYHYTDKAGITYGGSVETVEVANSSQLEKGLPVPVKYLAASPRTSRLDLPGQDGYEWRQSRNLGIFAAVFLGLLVADGVNRLRRL